MANLPVVAANPFKGLRAFQEADAVDFFGRAALVDRLVETVDLQPFTTVVGPSGSGKSSLVHAGAVPALRRAGALVASMVPGDDPLVELEAALRRVATAADEGTISARLATPGGLAVVAAELAGPGRPAGAGRSTSSRSCGRWSASDAVRDRFVELIANAAVPDGPLRVIATLRADLYDRPLRHPVLGPIVSDSTLAVTPLSSAELAEAIEAPAARIGVRFEPGLAATMVSDVAERPGALPLLQFTLTELYELRTQSTITVEAYQHLGGISGALASRAEQLYLELDEHRRGDVRTLFTELVMPGDDADDLRRRARLEELAGIDPAVIERYRTNRLLVTDHHPITREPTVEVAHEALLREWPRLATWIDEDRDTIRVRRMIGLAATEWHDLRPTTNPCSTGGPGCRPPTMSPRRLPLPVPEQEFLAASHELADREQVEREARVRRSGSPEPSPARAARRDRRRSWSSPSSPASSPSNNPADPTGRRRRRPRRRRSRPCRHRGDPGPDRGRRRTPGRHRPRPVDAPGRRGRAPPTRRGQRRCPGHRPAHRAGLPALRGRHQRRAGLRDPGRPDDGRGLAGLLPRQHPAGRPRLRRRRGPHRRRPHRGRRPRAGLPRPRRNRRRARRPLVGLGHPDPRHLRGGRRHRRRLRRGAHARHRPAGQRRVLGPERERPPPRRGHLPQRDRRHRHRVRGALRRGAHPAPRPLLWRHVRGRRPADPEIVPRRGRLAGQRPLRRLRHRDHRTVGPRQTAAASAPSAPATPPPSTSSSSTTAPPWSSAACPHRAEMATDGLRRRHRRRPLGHPPRGWPA